ncbi:MAG: copper-binding protein [Rubrivivax sp.]|nr:MAG: copper-binding protein [Rubrivivax sp.]
MKKLFLAAALACAHPAWAATEWVRGEVIQLDPARSRVTLKHEPIHMVKMAAMTMHFKVRDASLLAPLKIGDQVGFQVLEHDSELIVQQIEVRP